MRTDNTNIPEMPKPIHDKDWLSTLTREALIEEAYRRNQVIAEIVCAVQERALGKLSSSDFDKSILETLEGDGFLCANTALKSFKEGDAS